ncbi:hypothetical protein [Micromonospora sp. C95]|uniref:hypothetical protein n=1 Tax=Micromonospora sp. C95 TaxID=2824882 RepID=UPI0026573060|nr:hypothetical protein [Micromonospora sp. C95]
MSTDVSVMGGRPSVLTVLVAGGPGVGKTCFLRAASRGHAVLAGYPGSVWEIGYATLPGGVTVALRTTPDQRRWWWLWDRLAAGACGAVVLVDTTCLPASYPALDFLDARQVPYLVAVNRPTVGARNRREIREALRVPSRVPVLTCDAAEPASVLAVLHHLITAEPAAHQRHRRPLPLPDHSVRTKGLP